jgi:hypothetical protein
MIYSKDSWNLLHRFAGLILRIRCRQALRSGYRETGGSCQRRWVQSLLRPVLDLQHSRDLLRSDSVEQRS